MIVYALIAAAALALLWPAGLKQKKPLINIDDLDSMKPVQPERHKVRYLDAVACLQKVAKRLELTGELEDDQKEALKVITLAISRGSVSED